jgi:hypothetical protein
MWCLPDSDTRILGDPRIVGPHPGARRADIVPDAGTGKTTRGIDGAGGAGDRDPHRQVGEHLDLPSDLPLGHISRNQVAPLIQGIGYSSQFLVSFFDAAGNPIDVQFTFEALGAPVSASATAATAERRSSVSEPRPITTP